MEKPVKAKPQLYSVILQPMQEIAKSMGYNLVVHGSLNRDLDLIAIPWSYSTSTELSLLVELSKYLGTRLPDSSLDAASKREWFMYSKLPGNRNSYVINVNRYGAEDPQWYLDISFIPFSFAVSNELNALLSMHLKDIEDIKELGADCRVLILSEDGIFATATYYIETDAVAACIKFDNPEFSKLKPIKFISC